MKRNLIPAAVIAVCFGNEAAYALDTTTHSVITAHAFNRSVLNPLKPNTIYPNLGLSGSLIERFEQPFASLNGRMNRYLPVGSSEPLHGGGKFETDLMQLVEEQTGAPKRNSVQGWLIRGVIREDDNIKENRASDEPGGVFSRVYGHFHDPYNDRGLTFGVSLGSRAADWLLADDALADGRKNSFNLKATKESMYRALTGMSGEGVNVDGLFGQDAESRRDTRFMYWATTFRSLGNAIHLVQDMSQPQHTRNDLHSGIGCTMGECIGGHDSYYEKYIAARTLKQASFTLDEGILWTTESDPIKIVRPGLDYGDLSLPYSAFARYADFFSTGDGSASGKGLANYSSRNFYSFGTVGDGYPSPGDPSSSNPALHLETQPAFDVAGRYLNANITFFVGDVADTLLGTSGRARLASTGGWDQFMGSSEGRTLTYHNYDDQAAYLIPRATAYSTTFLDFFFRGRLEISAPDTGIYAITDHATAQTSDPSTNWTGFSGLKLRLSAPATDNNGEGQSLTGGELRAVLKFRRDICYDNLLSKFPTSIVEAENCRSGAEEIVVSDLANGGAMVAFGNFPQEFKFNFPKALPINATDVTLQVIYKGSLVTGGETEPDAIVVATKPISEPTYYSYLNASDYSRVDGQVYTRDAIAASPELMNKITILGCVDKTDPQRPVLKETCLQPADIDYSATIGGIPIAVENLPPKRFVRIAYLTDKGKTLAVVPQEGGNSCTFNEPDNVLAMSWSDNYTLPNEVSLYWTILEDVRSTRANTAASCVNGTHAIAPGVEDDRKTVWKGMTDVDPVPFLIKINDGQPYP